MKLLRRRFLHLAAGAAALPSVSRFAWAQAYPARPVRIIVGFAAGGGTDISARLIGQWLSERFGQQFIVENRPGAGSNIGAEAVARRQRTATRSFSSTHGERDQRHALRQAQFQFRPRHCAGRGHHAACRIVMEVNPSFPVKTVPEFIAYAKANPGKVNYGLGRQRNGAACRRRAVQDDDRRQHAARALSRHRTRADRSARRAGAGHVRRPCRRRSSTSGPAGCARSR